MSEPSVSLAYGSEYDVFSVFINENGCVSADKLESLFSGGVLLFDVPKDARFVAIERQLDRIVATLPAFKRIFAKPIVHLKDQQKVVATEAVRVINNYTLSYAMLHSELWDKDESGSIKPKKLMTIEKVENYVTYENRIFCRTVDTVLAFVKKTAMMLKDILYGCRELNFNLLDRTQHNSYFLAIGKLRKGYSDVGNKYNSSYDACVRKLLFIQKTIRPKLRSAVYVKCKGSGDHLALKKTNVFRSHKDYQAIYNLLKSFALSPEETALTEKAQLSVARENYAAYCTLLSLFSITHFNFGFKGRTSVNLKKPNASFSFLGWTLKLQRVEKNGMIALYFLFQKDKEYGICLLMQEKDALSESALQSFCSAFPADEYLFASASVHGERGVLYLSLYDIDSFRRIQQMLLRGMIYSDGTGESCAFCGEKMQQSERGRECPACRARITEQICEKTGKSYFVSQILQSRSVFGNSRLHVETNAFLHDRCAEAQLHFRNITEITADAAAVCPHCGRVHSV